MPAAEAAKLPTRHRWREGDVALLEAAAERLGVQVPGATWRSEAADVVLETGRGAPVAAPPGRLGAQDGAGVGTTEVAQLRHPLPELRRGRVVGVVPEARVLPGWPVRGALLGGASP